jgi:phosphate transport system substrate-binding protein
VAFAQGDKKPAAAEPVKVDPKIPEYKPVAGVQGNIKTAGSDTMNNLMTLWGEGFKKLYPKVQIEIMGEGSGTAMPALIQGTATFGAMSREVNPKELDEFKAKYGYPATALPTGIDMIAVYVHKDNPIAKTGLTLEQLDGIFSKNQKAGGKDLKTWGDLGLKGEWANEPIRLYGRNSVSGTYAYFKEHVLKKGDYKDTVKEQPGSSAVVQSIAKEKFAIGYSGIGYKTADVAVVPLGKTAKKMVEPSLKNMADYPLARYLYVVVNYDSKKGLDPLRREFLKFIFSKQGQEVVIEDGFLPLSAEEVQDSLKSVGLAK